MSLSENNRAEIGPTKIPDLETPESLFLTRVDLSQKTPLTPRQRGARGFLLSSLRDLPAKKTIIVLVGLPGVGKSTVLNTFAASFIQELGGIVSNIDNMGTDFDHSRPIVIEATPSDLPTIQKQFPDMVLEHHIKAMDEDETRNLFQTYMEARRRNVPEDKFKKLLQLSMGIPYLVYRLVRSSISEKDAEQIAFIYLIENFSGDFPDVQNQISNSLCILPPNEVIQRFMDAKGNGEKILENIINHAKEKSVEIQKNSIISEEPVELDAATSDIYSQALENPHGNQIGILVPQMSVENYQKVGQYLGFLRGNNVTMSIQTLRESAWFQMFGVDTRRMGLWTKMPNLFERTVLSKEVLDISAERNELQRMSKGLPIQRLVLPTGSLHVHAYGHHGNINPLLAGLAIEKLLQELGIMYVVRNDIAGINYYYDPEKRVA